LADLGIPILFAEPVNLDTDPDLEWIGVVDGGSLIWVYWDATQAGWQGNVLAILKNGMVSTPMLDTFEFTLVDINADGNRDLLSLREISDASEESMVDLDPNLAIYDLEADELLLDEDVDIDDLSDVDQDMVERLIDQVHMEELIPPMGMMPFYIQIGGEYTTLRSFLHECLDQLIAESDPAVIREDLMGSTPI
jgi:hypothetical protein